VLLFRGIVFCYRFCYSRHIARNLCIIYTVQLTSIELNNDDAFHFVTDFLFKFSFENQANVHGQHCQKLSEFLVC